MNLCTLTAGEVRRENFKSEEQKLVLAYD